MNQRMSLTIPDNQDGQSPTMDDFGQLAAGVAGEFNNLLTVIAGYSDLLLGLKELPADGRQSVQEIKLAAERAFGVTRQLLSFSRRDTAQPTRVALASLVEGMVPVLSRRLGEYIALETVMTGEGLVVTSDPVQLEWMFMNLVAHAKEAMREGGSLRIEVQRVTWEADAGVRVIVTDTGCGVDAATQAHLFEPCFATKRSGQGMGHHLAAMYQVVMQSRGAIRVTSEVGQGTSFTIDLPVAPADEPAEEHRLEQPEPCGIETGFVVEAEQAVHTVGRSSSRTDIASWRSKADLKQSSSAPAGKAEARMTVEMDIRESHGLTGGPSVLVVDDDPSVRRLLAMHLHEYGYRPRLAANGVEARAIVEMEEVSLILCDAQLPGESGPALVRDPLRQSRHTVALMMSGSDESEPAPGTHETEIYRHIAKTFDARDIANQIAQALCGRCLGGALVYGGDTFPWQRRRELTNA
jgi:CheY-like chemotaxis protein